MSDANVRGTMGQTKEANQMIRKTLAGYGLYGPQLTARLDIHHARPTRA